MLRPRRAGIGWRGSARSAPGRAIRRGALRNMVCVRATGVVEVVAATVGVRHGGKEGGAARECISKLGMGRDCALTSGVSVRGCANVTTVKRKSNCLCFYLINLFISCLTYSQRYSLSKIHFQQSASPCFLRSQTPRPSLNRSTPKTPPAKPASSTLSTNSKSETN